MFKRVQIKRKKNPPTLLVGMYLCSHYGKQYEVSLKKNDIELQYDPAIPFLGMYQEKMKTLVQKDMCTPMFIAALFTVAKIWKQPQCSSADSWLKKM